MKKGLLSIVVAAYNVQDYIEKCVDSLLDQTYENIEILVVNDGSTDKTSQRLKKYKNKDKVKVLNKENGGLSSARNYGMDFSEGEFLAFVDGDDFVDENTYKITIEKIKQDNSELCIFGYNRVYVDVKKQVNLNKKLYEANFLKKIFSKSDEASIVVWNKIFLNDTVKKNKISFENRAYFEDTGFIFRYLYFVKKISIVDKSLYNYIQRKDSITKKVNYIILDSLNRTYNIIQEFYKNNGSYQEYLQSIKDMKLRMMIYTYFYFKKNKINLKLELEWNDIKKSKIPFKHKFFLLYIKAIENIYTSKKDISLKI